MEKIPRYWLENLKDLDKDELIELIADCNHVLYLIEECCCDAYKSGENPLKEICDYLKKLDFDIGSDSLKLDLQYGMGKISLEEYRSAIFGGNDEI